MHLQVISCDILDHRTRRILEFFAKQSYKKGLKYNLILDLKYKKIRFILYAEKIFDIRLNLETVLNREKKGGEKDERLL